MVLTHVRTFSTPCGHPVSAIRTAICSGSTDRGFLNTFNFDALLILEDPDSCIDDFVVSHNPVPTERVVRDVMAGARNLATWIPRFVLRIVLDPGRPYGSELIFTLDTEAYTSPIATVQSPAPGNGYVCSNGGSASHPSPTSLTSINVSPLASLKESPLQDILVLFKQEEEVLGVQSIASFRRTASGLGDAVGRTGSCLLGLGLH